jgi:ABC-2 type transport system ATP-binding protein
MHALDIKQLRKVYGNGFEALKGIDLQVEEGDFFALLGANGAGKSTTIGLITTLLNISSGSIKVYGHDIALQAEKAKACIGLVPQEFNLNIFENCLQILLNQAGYYGVKRKDAKPRAEKLLKQLGLWEKHKTIVRELSGGMKRRLMIARSLIHEPKLLVLDEPTAGVDIEIRHSMWEFLTEINGQGTTIILTTHYLEEAEQLCKNIAIIDKGTIVENTSMKHLLQEFHHQTFVLNCDKPIDNIPDIKALQLSLIDDTSIEVRVERAMSLNHMFSLLSDKGITIHSMRNKTNRLEELFLDIIKNGHQ